MDGKIVDRIKKLLALGSKNSGATEDERMSALNMATALMTRYGIELNDIPEEERPKAIRGTPKVKRLLRGHIHLIVAAGKLYGCEAIFLANGKKGYFFVGRPLNIEAAEATTLWLFRQMNELHVVAKKAKNDDTWAFRRNFKDAFGLRVRQRVEKLMADNNSLAAGSGSTALTVQNYFDELRIENEELTKSAGTLREPKSYIGPGSYEGIAAGEVAKLRVEMNRSKVQ